jgi:hypothetical protein
LEDGIGKREVLQIAGIKRTTEGLWINFVADQP